MKHESLHSRVLGWMSAWLLVALLTTYTMAQEPPQKGAAGSPAKPAAGAAQDAAKLRGRLPAYFAKVVSEKQREDIYKIQARYNEQIEKLKEQLESLTTKRDTEVEQVLTDEQRAEIAKLKAARSRRGGSAETSTGTGTSGQ